MSRRLIFVDTETGGLDPSRHDVLTVALVDWRDGVLGESVEFKARADPARVDPEALAVNRIDLAAHNAAAEPAGVVADRVVRWCRARWHGERLIGGPRTRLAGHNVAFDVGFLRALIPHYGRQFDHRAVCTLGLLPIFWHAGLIASDAGRLGEACAAFGLNLPADEAHTALGDALASARLYTRMLELVRR